MTLRLTIQRYAFYYVVRSVLPEIVLVCLCALTPCLAVKPEHSGGGERMAFALSLLLTIFANMLFAADRRPPPKVRCVAGPVSVLVYCTGCVADHGDSVHHVD